LINRTNNCLSQ